MGLLSKIFATFMLLSSTAMLADDRCFCVYHTDGASTVIPSEYIDSIGFTSAAISVSLTNGESFTFTSEETDSAKYLEALPEAPKFTSFSFKKKLNDQLTESHTEKSPSSLMEFEVEGIGKYLTPTFTLSSTRAKAFVDGKQQISKCSRLRFAEDVNYTVEDDRTMILAYDSLSRKFTLQPRSTDYTVRVNWLTDKADNVPVVRIDVDGGASITSKDYYLQARIQIDGGRVFPSMDDSVSIKGRGNSSWNHSKKPYRLKFSHKVSPLGLTKGKNWVLLANAQKGSMMANAIGMKVAQLVGTPGANHILPVELYINGKYMGSYNLTEKVGLSANSIDIDDTQGLLLELDEYYDETYRFKSSIYSLPVNLHEPDLTDESLADYADEYFSSIKSDFNAYATAVSTKQHTDYIDVDAFCRYILVNNMILNFEINHPKSTYLYKDHRNYEESKYVFGPVWDLDWAFGYENSANYFKSSSSNNLFDKDWTAKPFFRLQLLGSTPLLRYYNKLCNEFVDNHLDELLDYVHDYYDYAKPSLVHNNEVWGDGANYESSLTNATNWLKKRASYITGQYAIYSYASLMQDLKGNVNGDEILSVGDIVMLTDYINGNEKAEFLFHEADTDSDGIVSDLDRRTVAKQVANYQWTTYPEWRTPFSDASISIEPFNIIVDNGTMEVPVVLQAQDSYTALQFDLDLPQGITLESIETDESHHAETSSENDETADATSGTSSGSSSASSSQGNTRRIIVYSDTNSPMSTTVATLILSSTGVDQDHTDQLSLTRIRLADMSGDEERVPSVKADCSFTTDINSLIADTGYTLSGGNCLTVTATTPSEINIYTAGGILFRTVQVPQGSTTVSLPQGIYIINHQKIFIR